MERPPRGNIVEYIQKHNLAPPKKGQHIKGETNKIKPGNDHEDRGRTMRTRGNYLHRPSSTAQRGEGKGKIEGGIGFLSCQHVNQ